MRFKGSTVPLEKFFIIIAIKSFFVSISEFNNVDIFWSLMLRVTFSYPELSYSYFSLRNFKLTTIFLSCYLSLRDMIVTSVKLGWTQITLPSKSIDTSVITLLLYSSVTTSFDFLSPILCKLKSSLVSSVMINLTSKTCPSYFKIADGVFYFNKLSLLQTRTLPISSPSAISYSSSLMSSSLTAISLTLS